MDQYTKHLAVHVLNESRVVNYRQLSRALKVHSHLAKQMLYDFHQKQNAKKPQSVHATYLITGSPRGETTESTNTTQSQTLDDDSNMQSSPFPSSFPEPEPLEYEDEDAEPAEEDIPETLVTLVKEEDLEEAKEEFEEIDSIFVYSLEPGSLQDIQIITNSHRELVDAFTKEDPLEVYQTYGIIQNAKVRRRSGRRPPPPSAPPVAAKPTPKAVPKSTAKELAPVNTLSRQNSATSITKAGATDSKANPATLKRDKSDLFSSFAKTKAPKAKAATKEATPAEDLPMKDVSEDEEDDFVMVETSKMDDEKAAAAKAEKAKRRKELEDMMDREDEEMEDVTQVDDVSVDEGSPIDKEPVEEPKETATVAGGRRRGKRRVMKKKHFKDSEGYMVTKEEAVWESFSEDEPQPKKVKTLPPTTAKGKKASGKPGQGNITSFFTKK